MILVTGSAGFIGFHISLSLLKEGYDVLGVDNLNNYYDPKLKMDRNAILMRFPNYYFEMMDLKDKQKVVDLFERFRPEYVLHFAAQAGVRYSIENPDSYIDSNILGFYNILEACKIYRPRQLFFASSSSVYGISEQVPFSINSCADRPLNLYAATKRSNELFAYVYSHLYDISVYGLRLFTVYGPWGRPDMSYFKFTQAILEDKEIELYNSDGDVKRDFTYIGDVVEVIKKMIFTPVLSDDRQVRYKIYNVGSKNPVKIQELVEILEQIIGKKAKKVYRCLPKTDVPVTYADTSDLERDFGIVLSTPLVNGLKAFYEWYKNYYKIEG